MKHPPIQDLRKTTPAAASSQSSETIQSPFQEIADRSPNAIQAKRFQEMANQPVQRNKDGEAVEPAHDAAAFSADQQKIIKQGFDDAFVMVTKAIPKIKKDDTHYQTYIDAGTTDTAKTDARVTHVKTGFDAIKLHLEKEKTTMKKWDLPADHKFKEANTYGYVRSTEKEANIYLGGVFWTAPATGFDSKAGTIIHELTHKLHGTKDHGYGQANSKKFAKDDPEKGSTNADSYEHFAEGA